MRTRWQPPMLPADFKLHWFPPAITKYSRGMTSRMAPGRIRSFLAAMKTPESGFRLGNPARKPSRCRQLPLNDSDWPQKFADIRNWRVCCAEIRISVVWNEWEKSECREK